MNNAELIKALRYCANENNICTEIENCGYYGKGFFCQDAMMLDAADALEAAEKRIEELERILKKVQENSGINFRLWQEAEAQIPKEGDWITADNPPKNEGLYLVGLSVGWDNEYVVRLARYTKDLSEALFSSKLRGDGWYRWDGDNDCDVICHPKYWMELPEPPNSGAKMQNVTDCHTFVER